MEISTTDPCSTCIIEQKCCRNFGGVKLSEAEYQQNFVQHQDELHVRQRGPVYIVASKTGSPCPHWNDCRCGIHETRPMDCRLFPYSMSDMMQEDGLVQISLHSRTECPHKEHLLPPKDKAVEIASTFARNAFGEDCELDVRHEGLLTRWKHQARNVVKRLLPRKLETKIVEACDKQF